MADRPAPVTDEMAQRGVAPPRMTREQWDDLARASAIGHHDLRARVEALEREVAYITTALNLPQP